MNANFLGSVPLPYTYRVTLMFLRMFQTCGTYFTSILLPLCASVLNYITSCSDNNFANSSLQLFKTLLIMNGIHGVESLQINLLCRIHDEADNKHASTHLEGSLNRLNLTLLTWRIWRAPNNASKLQMGFKRAFKKFKAQC